MVPEELVSKISYSISSNPNKPALIPFIVSGYPNFETTKKLLNLFEEKKVAAIELGIPFSDPLADGPIIQKASKASLENGTNINKIFEMLAEIEDNFSIPIILFTYYNPVLSFGAENFIKKAASLNVSGIIIPDLPLEEADDFSQSCKANKIDFIMLISPTSDKERIKKIAETSAGFIYLVSSTGVTGVRENFSGMLGNILQDIKKVTKIPTAVGFGVSSQEHISELKTLGADAAIIGSAIVRLIDKYKDDESLLISEMSEYLNSLYS